MMTPLRQPGHPQQETKKRTRGFASPGHPGFAIVGEIQLSDETIAQHSHNFLKKLKIDANHLKELLKYLSGGFTKAIFLHFVA
jgi:competence CoiA-like predicted nuclease